MLSNGSVGFFEEYHVCIFFLCWHSSQGFQPPPPPHFFTPSLLSGSLMVLGCDLRRYTAGCSRAKPRKCVLVKVQLVSSCLEPSPFFRLSDDLFSSPTTCMVWCVLWCSQGIGGSLKRAGTTLTRLKAAEVMDTVIMVASTFVFFATVCFVVYQRVPLLGLL